MYDSVDKLTIDGSFVGSLPLGLDGLEEYNWTLHLPVPSRGRSSRQRKEAKEAGTSPEATATLRLSIEPIVCVCVCVCVLSENTNYPKSAQISS